MRYIFLVVSALICKKLRTEQRSLKTFRILAYLKIANLLLVWFLAVVFSFNSLIPSYVCNLLQRTSMTVSA